ncbi:major facilitator superfamily domain-containing protein [Yarrowia lipolytica]|uniref:Major facilitator superfamily (MFS) profile domain-containing protein n=1 Tax=Yarrowia lipolytica TaxID=4952 RepID=A0A1H6Q8P2_YARLL|nr:hypothetical protein YALI1_A17749g [Yarrowia lipolytica]KAB8281336.1 major facilitator superfamily domain-containing protein [Yarrowia lipolytica]KAE8169629.1 major facilitator superfamily domain-containing protein [Yarrowia lipolytica]KAJ8051764.1 major facilitator superfamily domain-containing protein [Yarrowia lipolytica]QNP95268.1 MFS transporter prlL [Yarrowia lipolytica]
MTTMKPTETATTHVENISPNTPDEEVEKDMYTVDDRPESLASLTEEEMLAVEKKFVRRIDIRMLPMLMLIYILNYLDRNNIATARLGGLEAELGLTSIQYQTCVSILFVGYILMQIPSNMIVSKLGKPGLYLTSCMFIWGLISALTATVNNFSGLVVCRFFLGFIEAVYFPGCLFLLSSWYTRKELALRTSILYCGSLISGAFSGLLGAAIMENMNGLRGISGWKWLFIIEGSFTVLVVPFAWWILPDFPSTTRWLSQQEKDIAMYRLQREVGKADVDSELSGLEFVKKNLGLVIKDPKVWLVAGVNFFNVAAAGVTNFFPSVVQTLNFSRTMTLVLTCPPYLLATILVPLNSWHADKTGERLYHIIVPFSVTIASFVIAAATLNTAARYFAMCIMISSIYMGFVVTLTWMSNTIPRPAAKRGVAIALMNCLSNTTSIWNAYLYPKSAAPRYAPAMAANSGFLLVAIGCAVMLSLKLRKINKKLDKGEYNLMKEFGLDEEDPEGVVATAGYRYVY